MSRIKQNLRYFLCEVLQIKPICLISSPPFTTMSTTILRRTIPSTLRPIFSFNRFSTASPLPPSPPPPQPPQPTQNPQTPLDHQFQTWTNFLKPPLTPSSINTALTSISDADLAYDIFRWTSHHRGYHHDPTTYLIIINICVTNRRHRHAETLLDEVLSGACPVSLPLYNSLIKFCCSHRCLFNRAFDVYKKMIKQKDYENRPNLETYAMLFNVLLKKFNRLNVGYVYLNAVKSLSKQMKLFGVVPNTHVLNLIIKAYSKCLLVDEAIRVFQEMGLYGCDPNGYSFSYLVKGCCEKGRVSQGFGFFREMREKGFVGTSSTYMVLVCSLALERRFEDALEVLRDMLGNGMKPDLLTYRTLLEEMCRDRKGVDALEVLEEFRKTDVSMGDRMYRTLLDNLHFVDR